MSFLLKVGVPRELSVEELRENIARFEDLMYDPDTYKQSGKAEPMPIKWVVSPENLGGKAAITSRHSLHVSLVEATLHVTPPLHFHHYREIFIPIRGRFGIFCGKEEYKVEIGPLDTFSVPPGILRRPELLEGDEHGKGLLLVIFDTPGDPHEDEYVTQEQKDADVERGLGHLYRN